VDGGGTRERLRGERVLFAVAMVAFAIVLAWPLRVAVGGKTYDCGTLASSAFNKQYRRIYGEHAGRACEQSQSSQFTVGFFVIVGAMGAYAGLRVLQTRRGT
jgi:hypothetical protein